MNRTAMETAMAMLVEMRRGIREILVQRLSSETEVGCQHGETVILCPMVETLEGCVLPEKEAEAEAERDCREHV
jgi:hypothetical protein